MSNVSTTKQDAALSNRIKFGLFNVENLFLLFDQPIPLHYQKLNEIQWQKLSASVYENKPLSKCQQISQIILSQSPDILMLCEVGGLESLKNFNKLFLQESYDVALIEGNSDRNIDVGFLIKKVRSFDYAILSHKDRPLNFLYPHESLSKKTGYPVKKDSQFFSRDCVQLNLYGREAPNHSQQSENHSTLGSDQNPELVVMLTHLKSRLDPERIDPGGVERRTAELRTCLDIYRELNEKWPDVPKLFAGDLNGYAGRLDTDTEFNPIYKETDLEDVLELANVSVEKRSTFYQIKSGGRIDGKQIDYCFVSKHLKEKIEINSAFVYRYRDDYGFEMDVPKQLDDKLKLPSDHYPIFFTLEKVFKSGTIEP